MKNTIYEFNEKDPVIPLVNSKLQTYTRELCHVLGMKAFKVVQVTKPYVDWFEFFALDRFNPTRGDKTPINAMVLTQNGFVNAIIWIDKIDNRDTYFYNTGYGILDKGNRQTMKSVNLRPLIRRIKDNRLPIQDKVIIKRHNTYGDLFSKVTNIRKIERDIDSINVRGKDLHCVLELAKSASSYSVNKDIHTSYDYDSDMESRIKLKLNKLDKYYNELVEAEKISEEVLTKPLYMICKSPLHDTNECVVVKCLMAENEINILSCEHCLDLEDFSKYEDIVGILTIYKAKNEDTFNKEKREGKLMLNGLMSSEYTNDEYDKDVQICTLNCQALDKVSHQETSRINKLIVLNV